MAIFIEGMECPLCGNRIEGGEERVSFAPFVSNEANPLAVFSDGTFHVSCFRAHPLAEQAILVSNEARAKNAPGARLCRVCGLPVLDPDDYLGMGYHTGDPGHPLYNFNFAHLHRSCLASWSELARVCGLAQRAVADGMWQGAASQQLARALCADPEGTEARSS